MSKRSVLESQLIRLLAQQTDTHVVDIASELHSDPPASQGRVLRIQHTEPIVISREDIDNG